MISFILLIKGVPFFGLIVFDLILVKSEAIDGIEYYRVDFCICEGDL